MVVGLELPPLSARKQNIKKVFAEGEEGVTTFDIFVRKLEDSLEILSFQSNARSKQ